MTFLAKFPSHYEYFVTSDWGGNDNSVAEILTSQRDPHDSPGAEEPLCHRRATCYISPMAAQQSTRIPVE